MQDTSTHSPTERIYAIDWLRVLAFGVLIVYHTAEVFTTWKWWIKNNETSSVLSYVMMFFHEWRMLLLFLISGAATHLALGKRSIEKLVSDRIVRILLPLIAGMLFVIPPQIFFIQLHKGKNVDFLNFYIQLFEFNWFPSGNFHWLHLWYLAFLFAFTLMILPVIRIVQSEKGKLLINRAANMISNPYCLFLLVFLMEAPLYFSRFFSFNENLQQLVYYFPYYVFGALFLTSRSIRNAFVRYRMRGLIFATLTALILYPCFWITDSTGQVLFGLPLTGSANLIAENLLTSFNRWFWLITIIGYGLRYLNEGSDFLTYANKAIAPFYILHQTVIIILAYYTVDLSYSISIKFLMIISTTVISILVFYHVLLSRTKFTQLLFGIKDGQPKKRLKYEDQISENFEAGSLQKHLEIN